jgi:hypothetical protein
MKTIWKWSLIMKDMQWIAMPEGAEILTVQMQGDVPQVWALVDPKAHQIPRTIMIYGTGHPVDTERHTRYISTFQMHDGALVFHAFEALPERVTP